MQLGDSMIHLVVIFHFIIISVGVITLSMAWLYLRTQDESVVKALFNADLVFTLVMIMDAVRIYLSKNIFNLPMGFWPIFETVLYVFSFTAILTASRLVSAAVQNRLPRILIAIYLTALFAAAVLLGFDGFTDIAMDHIILPLAFALILFGSAFYGINSISKAPDRYRPLLKTYLAAMASYLIVVSVVYLIPGIPEWLIRVPYSQLIYLILNVLAILYLWKLMPLPVQKDITSSIAQGPDDYLEQLALTYSLTNREMEIVVELMEGGNNREIGEKLFVSPNTIKNHVYNIYKKTGVKSRFELMAMVAQKQKASKSQPTGG